MTNETPPQDLQNKVIVVTGASRGIGYQTALQLAERGAHILAVARTVGGLEDLDDAIKPMSGSATLVPMDLTDSPAIDRMGAAIFERWGHLDGLVGNGGILGTVTPVGHIKPSEWDKVLAVNLTANYRLIRSLDPLLRQAEAARICMISSSAAWKAKAFWGAYAASKAGLEALTKAYANECQQTAMAINALDPGGTRTAMRAKAVPGEDPETLPTAASAAAKVVEAMLPSFTKSCKLISIPDGEIYDLLPGYSA